MPLASVVVETINSLAGRSDVLDQIVFVITTLDIFKAVPAVAVLIAVTYRTFGSLLDERLTLLRALAGISAATVTVRLSQEVLPNRVRPIVEPGLDLVESNALDAAAIESLNNSSSFPSDHAALIVGVVAAVWLLNRAVGLWLGAYVVLFVLVPRVFFGYHYPSDILVGGLVGVAITLAAVKVPLGGLEARIHALITARPGISMALGFAICYQIANLFFDARTMLDALGLG